MKSIVAFSKYMSILLIIGYNPKCVNDLGADPTLKNEY